MGIDRYFKFRATRKRTRSLSPTPCERDRPLKRSFRPEVAAGDGTRELLPPSFIPPYMASHNPTAQAYTLSTSLTTPRPAIDEDVNVQDEPWVALTRNLTLLSARGTTTHEVIACGSTEENLMSLDEPLQPSTLLHSHPQDSLRDKEEPPGIHIESTSPQPLALPHNSSIPGLPSPQPTLPAQSSFLRAPSPPAMHTPPMCISSLPSHLPFDGIGTNASLLTRQELQQPQQPPPLRRSRFTMGPRLDCEKCRLGVPGHYAHFD